MFSICPKKVYQNKDLTSTDIRVYLCIQGFANAQGYCYPSIVKIAEMCGICRRTVERSLSALEKANVLARRKHIADNGGYTSNDYYLNLAPDDVTNGDFNDATKMSQGVRQECRRGCDKNVASNYKAIELECYVNNKNARAHTHAREGGENAAELSKEAEPVLEMEDLNDVLECLENIPEAREYKFFKMKGGDIGCRPSWELAQDDNIENEMLRFWQYTIKRELTVFRFNEHTIGEIEIKV